MSEIASHILIEGMRDSQQGWLRKLKISSEVFLNLVRENVFRKAPSVGPGVYRLDFVGVIATCSNAWFALPKVYSIDHADVNEMHRVLGCLQMYQRRILRGPSSSEFGRSSFIAEGGTLIDIFAALAAWSEEHGIHRVESRTETDDFAHIDWRSTLRNSLPAHQGNSVAYLDPEASLVRWFPSRLAPIQARALLDLQSRLGALANIWLPDHSILLEECRELVGSNAEYPPAYAMTEELTNSAFEATRDADVELIAILQLWAEFKTQKAGQTSLYGTTAFHTVWEAICASYLGTESPNLLHQDIASQPAYVMDRVLAVGPQRPDHIWCNGNQIWLADAKWYRSELGEFPQLADVTKQLFYELSVVEKLEVAGNFLLVPHMGDPPWKEIGTLGMYWKENADARFPDVHVISLSWQVAADVFRHGDLGEIGAELSRHRRKRWSIT